MKTRTLLSSALITTVLGLGLQTTAFANETGKNQDQSATMGEAVSDGWITTKIKAELASTKDLHSSHISVETNNGIATLTGTVPSEIEAKKAISTAESVKGVTQVDAAGLKVKAN